MRAKQVETPARHQAARASPDVAEVVNRPKKRPGRRQRSSITIRPASSQCWSDLEPFQSYNTWGIEARYAFATTVIASQRVGAKRRPPTGSAKQSILLRQRGAGLLRRKCASQ